MSITVEKWPSHWVPMVVGLDDELIPRVVLDTTELLCGMVVQVFAAPVPCLSPNGMTFRVDVSRLACVCLIGAHLEENANGAQLSVMNHPRMYQLRLPPPQMLNEVKTEYSAEDQAELSAALNRLRHFISIAGRLSSAGPLQRILIRMRFDLGGTADGLPEESAPVSLGDDAAAEQRAYNRNCCRGNTKMTVAIGTTSQSALRVDSNADADGGMNIVAEDPFEPNRRSISVTSTFASKSKRTGASAVANISLATAGQLHISAQLEHETLGKLVPFRKSRPSIDVPEKYMKSPAWEEAESDDSDAEDCAALEEWWSSRAPSGCICIGELLSRHTSQSSGALLELVSATATESQRATSDRYRLGPDVRMPELPAVRGRIRMWVEPLPEFYEYIHIAAFGLVRRAGLIGMMTFPDPVLKLSALDPLTSSEDNSNPIYISEGLRNSHTVSFLPIPIAYSSTAQLDEREHVVDLSANTCSLISSLVQNSTLVHSEAEKSTAVAGTYMCSSLLPASVLPPVPVVSITPTPPPGRGAVSPPPRPKVLSTGKTATKRSNDVDSERVAKKIISKSCLLQPLNQDDVTDSPSILTVKSPLNRCALHIDVVDGIRRSTLLASVASDHAGFAMVSTPGAPSHSGRVVSQQFKDDGVVVPVLLGSCQLKVEDVANVGRSMLLERSYLFEGQHIPENEELKLRKECHPEISADCFSDFVTSKKQTGLLISTVVQAPVLEKLVVGTDFCKESVDGRRLKTIASDDDDKRNAHRVDSLQNTHVPTSFRESAGVVVGHLPYFRMIRGEPFPASRVRFGLFDFLRSRCGGVEIHAITAIDFGTKRNVSRRVRRFVDRGYYPGVSMHELEDVLDPLPFVDFDVKFTTVSKKARSLHRSKSFANGWSNVEGVLSCVQMLLEPFAVRNANHSHFGEAQTLSRWRDGRCSEPVAPLPPGDVIAMYNECCANQQCEDEGDELEEDIFDGVEFPQRDEWRDIADGSGVVRRLYVKRGEVTIRPVIESLCLEAEMRCRSDGDGTVLDTKISSCGLPTTENSVPFRSFCASWYDNENLKPQGSKLTDTISARSAMYVQGRNRLRKGNSKALALEAIMDQKETLIPRTPEEIMSLYCNDDDDLLLFDEDYELPYRWRQFSTVHNANERNIILDRSSAIQEVQNQRKTSDEHRFRATIARKRQLRKLREKPSPPILETLMSIVERCKAKSEARKLLATLEKRKENATETTAKSTVQQAQPFNPLSQRRIFQMKAQESEVAPRHVDAHHIATLLVCHPLQRSDDEGVGVSTVEGIVAYLRSISHLPIYFVFVFCGCEAPEELSQLPQVFSTDFYGLRSELLREVPNSLRRSEYFESVVVGEDSTTEPECDLSQDDALALHASVRSLQRTFDKIPGSIVNHCRFHFTDTQLPLDATDMYFDPAEEVEAQELAHEEEQEEHRRVAMERQMAAAAAAVAEAGRRAKQPSVSELEAAEPLRGPVDVRQQSGANVYSNRRIRHKRHSVKAPSQDDSHDTEVAGCPPHPTYKAGASSYSMLDTWSYTNGDPSTRRSAFLAAADRFEHAFDHRSSPALSEPPLTCGSGAEQQRRLLVNLRDEELEEAKNLASNGPITGIRDVSMTFLDVFMSPDELIRHEDHSLHVAQMITLRDGDSTTRSPTPQKSKMRSPTKPVAALTQTQKKETVSENVLLDFGALQRRLRTVQGRDDVWAVLSRTRPSEEVERDGFHGHNAVTLEKRPEFHELAVADDDDDGKNAFRVVGGSIGDHHCCYQICVAGANKNSTLFSSNVQLQHHSAPKNYFQSTASSRISPRATATPSRPEKAPSPAKKRPQSKSLKKKSSPPRTGIGRGGRDRKMSPGGKKSSKDESLYNPEGPTVALSGLPPEKLRHLRAMLRSDSSVSGGPKLDTRILRQQEDQLDQQFISRMTSNQ